MGQMHNRRVRAAENRPHFDDATCKPNQFAVLFAAALNRRAGLEALPAAARQYGAPEFDWRRAEPGAAAQDFQTRFTIHAGGP